MPTKKNDICSKARDALRRAHYARRKLPLKVSAHISRCEGCTRYQEALQVTRRRWKEALSTDPESTPTWALAHKLARRIVRFASLCRVHAPATVIRDQWTSIHLALLEVAADDSTQVLRELPNVLFDIGVREAVSEADPEGVDEVEEWFLKGLEAVPV